MDLGEASLAVFGRLKCSLSYDKQLIDVDDIVHGTKAKKFSWSELRRNVTPLAFVAHILIKLRLKIPALHDLSKLYA